MKKILTFCFVLLTFKCSSVLSQSFRVQLPPGYNKILVSDEIPGKEGNPYLFEDWLPGTLILKNGIKIDGLKYRYCVYNKEMQYQLENVGYAFGAPDSISQIMFGNKVFIYTNFLNGNHNDKDFFEVLVDGKAKFLVRYVIEIIHANYNAALSTGNKNDRINIKEQYYIQRDGANALLIDKKGKSVEFSLFDKMKEIKEFIDKEKISFKEKGNLISLIKFYNSIN